MENLQLEEKKSIPCPLPANKVVYVQPIIRDNTYPAILNKSSAAKHSWSGTTFVLRGVPLDVSTRKYVEPLTKEERDWFESAESGLDFKKNDLLANKFGGYKGAIKKSEAPYWTLFSIVLEKDNPLKLRLSDWHDYLKYKFLLTQKHIVANGKEEAQDLTKKFVLVDSEAEVQGEVTKKKKEFDAYKALGRLETSRDNMFAIWYIYYLNNDVTDRPPQEASNDQLYKKLTDFIEFDVDKFLAVVNDIGFNSKANIVKAILDKVIRFVRQGKVSYFEFEDKKFNNFAEIVKFMDNPLNQEYYMKLVKENDVEDNPKSKKKKD